MQFDELITFGIDHHASDLHLSEGCYPIYRIDGELKSFHENKLNYNQLYTWIQSTLNTKQQQIFYDSYEIDYAFTVNEQRLRSNIFHHQRGLSAAFRFIANEIKNFYDLNLPSCVQQFCHYRHGLVLVTGATGSGKSTTLSSLINQINQTQHKHIITIEDPVEYVYENDLSLIQQREVKRDTVNFSSALRMALRQDPDVILLGEMRDRETIRLALEAAETGHLVFATLHASSAIKAIDRILQIFSGEEQAFIRLLLSNTLRAIIAQELVPRKGGGRIAIHEIMLMNAAISNLIRENKLMQIHSVMQTNQVAGMQTREQSMDWLRRKGLIG